MIEVRGFSMPAGIFCLQHSRRIRQQNLSVELPILTMYASLPIKLGMPMGCKLERTAAGGPFGPGGPRLARDQEPQGGAMNTKLIRLDLIQPKMSCWMAGSLRSKARFCDTPIRTAPAEWRRQYLETRPVPQNKSRPTKPPDGFASSSASRKRRFKILTPSAEAPGRDPGSGMSLAVGLPMWLRTP